MKKNPNAYEALLAEKEAKAVASLLIAAEARLTRMWELVQQSGRATSFHALMVGVHWANLAHCRRWLMNYVKTMEEARTKT
jgi:hypothetical protein